jgi:hypothetical protein
MVFVDTRILGFFNRAIILGHEGRWSKLRHISLQTSFSIDISGVKILRGRVGLNFCSTQSACDQRRRLR